MRLHNLFHHHLSRSFIIMALRSVSLGVKFLLTLYIARFMGFESLGLYGLISAASIMAPSILGLGLMHVISRKAVTQSLDEITHALVRYGCWIALVYLPLIAVAVVSGLALDKAFLFSIVALIVLAEHVNQDLYALVLNLSKPFFANFLHFIRSALWAVIFMALAFFERSFLTMEYLLIFWLGGSVLSLFGFFIMARKWPWPSDVSFSTFRKWIAEEFRISRVNYMTGLASTGSQYLDRYIVTMFLGLELTGVYVFFMQATSAMANLLNTGVIQIARPKMVRAFKNKSGDYMTIYRDCLKHAVLFAIAMAVAGWVAMYLLIPHINRPLAAEWFPVFWVILVAFVMGVIEATQQLIFYSQYRDDITLKVYIVALVSIVAANFVLIPFLGLWGVACSLVVVGALKMGVQRFYIRSLADKK
ncbi:MAG TPA: hypothetical protein DEA55_05820 [Rhodospirillaceae bacterium]|nr:hypothetical protein [Rhodospirillaceae bacterium]